jgi:hypothetical protein
VGVVLSVCRYKIKNSTITSGGEGGFPGLIQKDTTTPCRASWQLAVCKARSRYDFFVSSYAL